MQLCGSLSILWHCLSLGLERKLTFSSPVATAEFSKIAGILSAALSQDHFQNLTSACLSVMFGIDLDYADVEWFALETNQEHSVILEIATKYCISYSSVDYEGYSMSSKRFYTDIYTVVDMSHLN